MPVAPSLIRHVPTEVARVVGEFKHRLQERFGDALRDVRIFGSYARENANEDSDIDVFVLLERARYAERRAVLDITGDLLVESELLVSPTIFDEQTHQAHLEQQRPLVMEIERDGMRI